MIDGQEKSQYLFLMTFGTHRLVVIFPSSWLIVLFVLADMRRHLLTVNNISVKISTDFSPAYKLAVDHDLKFGLLLKIDFFWREKRKSQNFVEKKLHLLSPPRRFVALCRTLSTLLTACCGSRWLREAFITWDSIRIKVNLNWQLKLQDSSFFFYLEALPLFHRLFYMLYGVWTKNL
jgi:hypothetical protein